MVESMRKACSYKTEKDVTPDSQFLQACFDSTPSARTVYNLEVCHDDSTSLQWNVSLPRPSRKFLCFMLLDFVFTVDASRTIVS